MARKPSETTVKVQAPPLVETAVIDLDRVVPAGPLALVEGARAIHLHKDSAFSTTNDIVRKGLYEDSVISVAGTPLPVTAADLYLERLQIVRAAVAGAAKGAELKASLLETKKKIDGALEANLTKIMDEQRSMERAWREVDAFIKLARRDAGAPVALRIANASVEVLCQDDAKFQQLSKAIPKSSELSMQDMVGLLVLPSWVHGKALLKKFGEMAVDAKMLVVCGVPADLAATQGLFGVGGTMTDVAGTQRWQQQVVLVGNDLRTRKADRRYERDRDDIYISAATVLAGQIAKGDVTTSLADAQAGGSRQILLEGDDVDLRWKLTNRDDILAKLGGHIVPAARKGNQLVFWGVRNLFRVQEGDKQQAFSQYPTVRVRDYISKQLIEYLNSETIFRENTDISREDLKRTINNFIQDHSGPGPKKMLVGGECQYVKNRVTGGAEDERKVDIGIVLKFKGAVENVDLDFKAARSDDGWKQEPS